MEVNKPGPEVSYQISFAINQLRDTLRVQGVINDPLKDQLRLNGPMMKMYQSFILTYNDKLPPVVDSTQVTDPTPGEAPVKRPTRTITVVKK
ncbi:hypothetical protein [Paraflavitalea speifideaquila]|uniref:hypothetical protein n=1 Tax=Paraflavitalea speifideaquila TaxID=3076558 RepID=UPI0028EECED3|nr:hypothetical protein [Paraflavitalea speifideiaquila]